MVGASWPHYPPCVSEGCTNAACCGQEFKYVWPKLVGKPASDAAATINKSNPAVIVLILKPGFIRLGNFCCNRVYVFTDEKGIVSEVPTVG
ncbi:unnamed protein product [Malus baccata var. baccata]